MSQNICILDYGSGNVRSVFMMMSRISSSVQISNKPRDIQLASHLILPGVGSFAGSMAKIKKITPLAVVSEEIFKKKKPLLGICVGLQVMATNGKEFGTHKGLDWIPGTVQKLDSKKLPLPHIGWNNLENTQAHDPLLKGLSLIQDFYFVHSFHFLPKSKKNVLAWTEYGQSFASIIRRDNIYGVQFHPEKSQKAGMLLLQNFINLQ